MTATTPVRLCRGAGSTTTEATGPRWCNTAAGRRCSTSIGCRGRLLVGACRTALPDTWPPAFGTAPGSVDSEPDPLIRTVAAP